LRAFFSFDAALPFFFVSDKISLVLPPSALQLFSPAPFRPFSLRPFHACLLHTILSLPSERQVAELFFCRSPQVTPQMRPFRFSDDLLGDLEKKMSPEKSLVWYGSHVIELSHPFFFFCCCGYIEFPNTGTQRTELGIAGDDLKK
jgi:hypothetical protein